MSARVLRVVLSVGLIALFLVAGATAALAAPVNDNFAARISLTGIHGQIDGTNVGATGETGEPDHAGRNFGDPENFHSVWYDWTTQTSGPALARTCHNPTFDTTVAVYTGDSVDGLTLVAENDDGCNLQSVVNWTAVAGQNYKIAVDGVFAAQGTFTLEFSQCTIDGSSGNDVLVGTNGDDVICAGPGDDQISGRRGNDIVLGEAGNDFAQLGGGADQFDGGDDSDTVDYNEGAVMGPATIHLGTQTGSAPGAGGDTFASVENANGSSFGDSITGSAGPNVISGREGNDTVNGKGGNDTIDGRAGDDTLSGENGADTVTGGAGVDTLNGNAGADTLNAVDGVGGNDTVDGGSDADLDTCSADPGDTVTNCP